eukprot:scaffold10507_cov128-Cylindrotheca_fusiformis.AAC.14
MTVTTNSTSKEKATKAKRARKPRRQLPEKLDDLYIGEGESPTPLDVVGGRGGVSNNHRGNQRYWKRILAERPKYKSLGKKDNNTKTAIAQSIMDFVTDTGGRFLQKHENGRWIILPKKIVIDKIKQALRDKHVPDYAREDSSAAAPGSPKRDESPPPARADEVRRVEVASRDFLQSLTSRDFMGLLKPQPASMDLRFPSYSSLLEQYNSLNSLGSMVPPRGNHCLSSDILESLRRKNFESALRQPFFSFSAISNIPSADGGLESKMRNLPSFCNNTSRSSLDLMQSYGSIPFANDSSSMNSAYAVPKKLSSVFNAKFEEVFSPSGGVVNGRKDKT